MNATRSIRRSVAVLLAAAVVLLGLPQAQAAGRVIQLGKVRAHPDDKRVEIDGEITLEAGTLIEVLACTPFGKTHETVMTVDCVPSQVHAALLLIGLKPGKPVTFQGENRQPQGDPVKLSVRWTENDKPKTVRAEDLLYNVKQKQPMKHQYWVFCGSVIDAHNEKPYLADLAGNIVTTYHDSATVIDNPSEAGADDDMLEINADVCPKPRTKITLILEPAPAAKTQP